MSQASKYLDWCLNKAAKELQEGKKHRGLLQVKPNLEKATLHLEKAEHNFKAISYFNSGGYSDWSVSAAFYTLYHCFLAILAKHGYESRNQECTISVIQQLREQNKILLEQKFLEALQSHAEVKEKHEHTVIELRENYQYGVRKEIEGKEKILQLTSICKEMIEKTKEEVYIKT